MSVKGINEVIDAIGRIQQGFSQVDREAKASAQIGADYASQIVPRRSGALARAQRVFQVAGITSIGIDPSVTNPRGQRPFVYGPIVAKRTEDFYAMIVDSRGSAIANRFFELFTEK
jgi:hypothetical protein